LTSEKNHGAPADATTCPITESGLTLKDADFLEAPYSSFSRMQDEAPAYCDPKTGIWIVTRFEDVKRIHRDTETFSNSRFVEQARSSIDAGRAKKMVEIYRAKGWVPGKALAIQDGKAHQERRSAFLRALRIGKVKEMEPFIRETARKLIDGFVDRTQCEFIEEFAVPLPMTIIATQLGAKAEDVPMIKKWTDLWIERLGMMQTEEEEIASVEAEIEAQHYFKPLMDEMREHPNGTVLSELLNTTFSNGERMSDREFFGHMMPDMFVGGSETASNVFGNAMMLLCQNPELEAKARSSTKQLAAFIEEAMRLESPVQMLYRVTTVDVDISGVTVPAGSVVGAHYGAANRDPRHFGCPAGFDLDRENINSHAVFGPGGPHTCLGAPLARLELLCGFEELLKRMTNFRAPADINDFRHHPNMVVRSLKKLNVTFDKCAA
jgi:cytochrome P450